MTDLYQSIANECLKDMRQTPFGNVIEYHGKPPEAGKIALARGYLLRLGQLEIAVKALFECSTGHSFCPEADEALKKIAALDKEDGQ